MTNRTPEVAVAQLRCEYQTNPIGIDVRQPRLAWQLTSSARGVVQTAYHVRVGAGPDGPWLWDTGKVASDASIHVPYGGSALASRQRYTWQVRVWATDAAGSAYESAWSAPAFFEMGLLDPAEWQAEWITPDWDEDTSRSQPGPLLRREFTLDGAIKSARVYVTSLGLYELHINGQRVGDELLTPGWTAYHRYIQYQTYDVTGLLRSGANAVGALLGDGWFRGFIGFEGNRNTWGDRLALLLQLHVTYEDGRTAVIASDGGWAATQGPIRMADIYMGEVYDARLDRAGWTEPGYAADDWTGVRVLDHDKQTVVAQTAPPVTRQEELRPVEIIRTPAGELVVDFGQNMVGWVRLRVQGPTGTTVTLRHAEVLDQQGNFYITNLRSATQLLQYTLKGAGVEVYEPHFTFMGFRYVKVEGWPGELTLDDLTGVVVHSEMPVTGEFECSNPLVNQLQHNIEWGQKGNFVDVPTDCPQRDERLGWTGDAQVFIRTATFNRDVAQFFTKWLRDLAAEQGANGGVPMVIPDPMGRSGSHFAREAGGSAAWADAATICPWTIYVAYGDRRILEQQYDSMKAWVGYMRRQAGDTYLWTTGFHFGDWLDYRGNPGDMAAPPITDKELIASAFFAYSTSLLQQAAEVLGKADEAAEYADLLAKIKKAFVAEYVSENGRVASNSQSAYVLALHFDLLPEHMRQSAADRLAQQVRAFGYHLTTGFVGTPYLCHVLSRFGHTDLAYELLNQESYPSWLYPVKMGATTIWERWDGIKPDGSFQDEGMNSFNHYAYGAIGDWLYRVSAGLDTALTGPGYKHITVRPQPGGGLTHVRAALRTPYGLAVSAWQLTKRDFSLQVTVPANARATVYIPASSLDQVTEGGRSLADAAGVSHARVEDGAVVVEVGSGEYAFVSTGFNLEQAMKDVRHIAGRLDLGSALADVLANERARAVLARHVGEEMLNHPFLRRGAGTQPLDALARFNPALTPERMKEIERDLLALA